MIDTVKMLSASKDSLLRALNEDGGRIDSYGLMGALDEMIPHWRSQISDGESESIITSDLEALEKKIAGLRKILEEQNGTAPKSNMTVSLDGGQTFVPAPQGVRVTYHDVMVDAEDEPGLLEFNMTHEGVITDLWVSREDKLDHNLGTDSALIEDILQSRLIISD